MYRQHPRPSPLMRRLDSWGAVCFNRQCFEFRLPSSVCVVASVFVDTCCVQLCTSAHSTVDRPTTPERSLAQPTM